MICHTDAVVGNRTTRDNDDEDADGDEDHGSIQRRVDASTSLDDARMRASLEADDKTRTNKTVRCRVASTCPVERRANWSSSTGFQAAYRSSPIVIVLYAVTNGINSSDRNSSSGTSNSQWKIRKREHGIIYARRRRTRVVVASCADYQVSDDSPRTLQPSRSRRKDAISRRNERCRAASDPRRGTSSAASSVLRRPARRAKLLAIRPSRARSYLTSVMAAVPDMSHLTPEERSTIEEVIIRQKQEEEKENEIMRRKQDEVTILEERIRACSEKHKKAGVELHATCHICLKTKFADGVGHICNYCSIRCCARCGGKVTLRSNKVIWVCILCRKKQELLSKTGQWITKAGLAAGDNAMLRRMQDMQVGGPPGLVDQTQDKRPKLERAHSAAEKENLPLLLRSGSLLRRQYSQQEQGPGRRLPTSDSGVDMSVSPHSRSLPTPHVASPHQMQQPPRHPDAYAEDDPNLYRGEIDGLMKQQNYQRQRPIYPDQNTDLAMTYGQPTVEAGPPRSAVHPTQQHSVHQTQSAHPPQPMGGQVGLQPQRSFSSSEEERSTPECASDEPDESEKGKGYYHHTGGPISMSSGGRRHNGPHNGHHNMAAMTIEYNGHHPPREPRKEESTLVRRSFRRSGDEWRSDSRRFTERRGKKTVRFHGGTNVGGPQEDWSWEADRQGSQDSATKDSGIDTSSTFTSSEDSNRGDLPKHPLSWQVSRDGQKIIGHMVLRKQPGSGSASSSSILGLKVVGGKLLEDGSMGAVIEKVKKGSTADIEGQLRPGDEVIKWNGRSLQGKSFREVYDIIAESRQEPQVELVVSRNLSSTTGPVTMPAGLTPTAPMPSRKIAAQIQWRQKHPETISGPQQPHHKGLKKCILWELYDARREKPSVLVTSPGSPDLHAQGRARHLRHTSGNANVGGNLQVKLSFDSVALRLIVTLICAAGLTPRSNGQPRNPYAKIFLLPDKSEKSKRRTKTLANTNDPKWNQTFIYDGIRRPELRKRALEVTVWDYGKYDTNDFLGEAILELATAHLDEEPEWHPLTGHGEHRHIGYYQEPDDMVITPVDCHLSPPSTTSRLSDSDTSECDITDCDVSREQRRTADGASISSIGSSSRFHNMPSNYKRHYSSPPPERELCIDGEHRSRRDMSPQGRKRAAIMIRDQPASISGYQTYRKDDIHRGMMGHRSHSAAPMDSPSLRYRGRSQSPTGHRSLSPPEHRSMLYSHGYVPPRFSSRSATATPTGSPKKRQLPLIPTALKERAVQDPEERARFMRHRNRQVHTTYRSTGTGGWEKHYSGLSDSDLLSIDQDPLSLPHSHPYRMHRPRRGNLSPDKDVLGDLGDSDMESIASVTSSAFSTQSERPRGSRGLIEYSQSGSYEKPSRTQPGDNEHDDHKRGQFTRSLSNTDAPQDEKVDGSLSDTAIGLNVEDSSRRGRKSSPGSKSGSGSSSGGGSAVQYQSGLGKKSNSTSQLSATECGIGGIFVGSGVAEARAGLSSRKRNSTPSSIQRSEEIVPYQRFESGKQSGSLASDTAGSLNSISSSEGSSWSPSLRMTGETGQLRDFIEDLGPGQVVGRQALGARCLGEIQLSLTQKKGYLEVEVIRAKDLKPKQGTKAIPASYVKVYLVNGKKCIAKAKTMAARKTLDPFYQQSLAFRENCRGCILQVTVWGDYGRLEGRKVFMGIAQIVLDELNLNEMVFGWYKLFGNISL
ncbi:regulating synaptic membrane exocytosis protein 2 isoform X13 [Bombus impatiens]|uniref:Regulating synaptic membrane exocytosis protein 2 isoform X13 n=1 Tax=Bombus impatiens TaxID=132113 RepID=A0A6P8LMZ4_BOMIM|nr:regulating synaptic membrane exocytosis protein 2 isoform X13 [Bombus impatiens]